jgi:hypothetical protein
VRGHDGNLVVKPSASLYPKANKCPCRLNPPESRINIELKGWNLELRYYLMSSLLPRYASGVNSSQDKWGRKEHSTESRLTISLISILDGCIKIQRLTHEINLDQSVRNHLEVSIPWLDSHWFRKIRDRQTLCSSNTVELYQCRSRSIIFRRHLICTSVRLHSNAENGK